MVPLPGDQDKRLPIRHPTKYPFNRIVVDLKNPVSGLVNAYLYSENVSAICPADHYTPRIVPVHPHATVPLECGEILWMR